MRVTGCDQIETENSANQMKTHNTLILLTIGIAVCSTM